MVKTRNQQKSEISGDNQSNESHKKHEKITNKQKRGQQNKKLGKKARKNQESQCNQTYLENCESSQLNYDYALIQGQAYQTQNIKNKKEDKQYTHGKFDTEELECPICLVEIKNKLSIFKCQTCNQEFHSYCIQDWFSTKDIFHCPICNTSPFK